jgi:lycopene cyclase-like protein
MPNLRGSGSGRVSSWLVAAMVGMVALPAALTLHTVRISSVVKVSSQNPSPYGYTVSLLLFVVPILVIGLWFIPKEQVKLSRKAFWTTIAVLFPLGAMLDFFFAHLFLTFPNPNATLGIRAPALGGGVPVEEYLFYLTGFIAVLLMYIWLDEYWLSAYTVPAEARERSEFERLISFHPESVALAVVLIGGSIFYKKMLSHDPTGFPGYFVFLALTALAPSAALLPMARPVINWRAFSLTFFIILLTSLLWEATLAVPYGWWGYQPSQMMGLNITAWAGLPIEAVCVWMAVTYMTVIVYEIVKRWKASGRTARHAFLG